MTARWAAIDRPRTSAPGPRVVTAADMSCLMHLGGLLQRDQRPLRVMHVAEILAEGRRDLSDARVRSAPPYIVFAT